MVYFYCLLKHSRNSVAVRMIYNCVLVIWVQPRSLNQRLSLCATCTCLNLSMYMYFRSIPFVPYSHLKTPLSSSSKDLKMKGCKITLLLRTIVFNITLLCSLTAFCLLIR